MEDPDVRQFRAQLKLLHRRLRREVPPVPGLSGSALQVLDTAARAPEWPQPREVANELNMASSNVAAALRELETAGFILRDRDADDARCVRLRVTEAGISVLAGIRSERDTWFGAAVEAVLSDREQRTLLAAGRLLQRLAEYDAANPAMSSASAEPALRPERAW